MQKSYLPDLSSFTLNDFRDSLLSRTLIPSRTCLLEGINRTFGILTQLNIATLPELITVLKTKEKIRAFAELSGIDESYLIILKREASSYIPKAVSLDKFQSIQESSLSKLKEKGIVNTLQFFNALQSAPGSDSFSAEMDLSLDEIKVIESLSDLVRLYGVGPVFAEMILESGIPSISDFLRISPGEFIELYEQKSGKKADFSQRDMEFTHEIASIIQGCDS